jgi:SAM-dependent methyltransferase
MNLAQDCTALDLYLAAVQDPHAHARFLHHLFSRVRPTVSPRILREDFAGTGADALAWVKLDRNHSAWAIEQDAATHEWAQARADRQAGFSRSRLHFVQSRVEDLDPSRVPSADLISALNFSIGYLHSRPALLDYLCAVHSGLSPGGLFVASVFGGPETIRPGIVSTEVDAVRPGKTCPGTPAFEYQWEVRRYNPVTGRGDFRIHFRIPKPTRGSGEEWELRDAFRYDWRLWSLPELSDALRDAGFGRVQIWRHTLTTGRKGPRIFLGPIRSLGAENRWIAYVVGIR